MTRILIALTCGASLILCAGASGQEADPLAAGFQSPPAAAKPRVWWHWMDGNVSEDGIRKDLTWLNQVGVGGVHNFDAALAGAGRDTTHLVKERVAYLTPQWREMFRFAVSQARQLGMEFTIAASPGWSESGGPWVKPAQGMKKFVWSETRIAGGQPGPLTLKPPPQVTGPFQNVPFSSVLFAADDKLPQYYADVAVVAYRTSFPADSDARATITSSAGSIDAARLSDGDVAQDISLPYGTEKTAWIRFEYPKARRIQSMTLSVARPSGIAPSDVATGGAIWLEASDDGKTFRRVVDVPRDGAPEQTLAFAPTSARVFRLVLERPAPSSNPLDSLIGRPAGPAPTAHRIMECVLHAEPRVNRFEDKAGFTNRAISATEDTIATPAGEAIARDSIVDLTGKLRADGTLDWAPPAGQWVVLRFGYSLTGRTNHPASREGTGLEVDKLNREHVKAYFNDYFAEYAKTLGADLVGHQGLQYMLTDSYEAGIANWTDDILSQFKTRRGYDPRPFLPALAGRVVVSADASDRFLWDFRQTLGDLIADAHYGQLSESLHEHGMKRYGESHESGRAFVGDGMQVKKSADVPMGALWAAAPWAAEARYTYQMDIRESASVAHLYGQNLVAAESLTAFGNTFAFTPESLKPHADRMLAAGLNRFVIHTSVHQPDDRLGPGATLGPFGQWFTRHETWAGQARPWITYLARSSYLLQQGRFVADIAYLYGEDNNITNLFGRNPPAVPAGYNYDFVNADALLHLLSVRDGKLVAPSGMEYRVLVLDASTARMSLPVLHKIADLVSQGATVMGARPARSPSLNDDEAEFSAVATRLWGTASGPQILTRSGARATSTLAAALRLLNITPDCLFAGSGIGPELRYVHRAIADGDLYFVASDSPEARKVEASFRVSGQSPELWHADTGERAPAPYRVEGGRTIVPLSLDPSGSVFVVFRQSTGVQRRVIPERTRQVMASVGGPWNVSFQPDHGAPPGARFASLSSWTTNADPGIKYFSGTATYSTRFNAQREWLKSGARIQLDLGEVKNLAEVSINGRVLGVLWKTPFAVDITDAVRAGDNQLEIRVTNLWPNRMIGDKQPGAKQIAFATYDPYKADSPLLPSGLLGPVSIVRLSASQENSQ
jgi:hypothetical protein